jgi:hypothetical protein
MTVDSRNLYAQHHIETSSRIDKSLKRFAHGRANERLGNQKRIAVIPKSKLTADV